MEIRLIFFKEIVGLISLKKEVSFARTKRLRSREEKSRRRFFLPKVSLISILQKSTDKLTCRQDGKGMRMTAVSSACIVYVQTIATSLREILAASYFCFDGPRMGGF